MPFGSGYYEKSEQRAFDQSGAGYIDKRKTSAGIRRTLLCCLIAACLFVGITGCGAGRKTGVKEGAEREAAPVEGLEVSFFSCSEDADSILLQTAEGVVMIDTGVAQDAPGMIRELQEKGIGGIDLLILTHPDKDHIGGAESLLNAFSISEIMQTGCVKDSAMYLRLQKRLEAENAWIPSEIQVRDFGELRLTVYPPRQSGYEQANDYSIAVLACYQGKNLFFAGDAEKVRIKELLAEQLPRADIYKVAYHGRKTGKSDDLIRALQPRYAVVTAREAENKIKKALKKTGTTVYSSYGQTIRFTVRDGEILDGNR